MPIRLSKSKKKIYFADLEVTDDAIFAVYEWLRHKANCGNGRLYLEINKNGMLTFDSCAHIETVESCQEVAGCKY